MQELEVVCGGCGEELDYGEFNSVDKRRIQVVACKRCEGYNKEEKLKPCPFCGGEGRIYSTSRMTAYDIPISVFWIECISCPTVIIKRETNITKAKKLWNTRIKK